MQIQQRIIDELVPYRDNPRTISAKAVEKLARIIERFGFLVPVILDAEDVVVAGHTRLRAAAKLGMTEVPCVVADDLTPDEIRAFRLAENKAHETTGWDLDLLPLELAAVEDAGVEIELTGFTLDEVAELNGDLPHDGTGPVPDSDSYQEQYGVIVVCDDEADQERVFTELQDTYENVRVVTT